jgi:hypothetical protein
MLTGHSRFFVFHFGLAASLKKPILPRFTDSDGLKLFSGIATVTRTILAVYRACCGSAIVLDRLRDALVGVSQQTRSRLVESLQFNELKVSYRKTHGPHSFGGSEEIVLRIADCVLFAHPGKAFACTICVSITKAGFQSASCFYPGMVERN